MGLFPGTLPAILSVVPSLTFAEFCVQMPRTLDFNNRTRAKTMHPSKTPDPATGRSSQPINSPRPEPNADPDSLIRQEEAALILGVSPRAMENFRYRGRGPSYVKISARCIRYRRSDLRDFIEERVRTSTSDPGKGRP